MKSNTQQFINKAKLIHGDKYNYSKVEYINSKTKVCIICPIHGEFWQRPSSHLQGKGCLKCGFDKTASIKRLTREEFITKAKEVHDNKYDYSKVIYKNSDTKVEIICPTHGSFFQTPYHHLQGHGCKKCGDEAKSHKLKMNTTEFIIKAKEIHGNKYDYSKVKYDGVLEKVCIICPYHGEFWQTPDNHIQGCGCPECNQSHLEKEIQQELEILNIEFEYNKKYNFLNGLQLDFYIPSKKIAIECQGKQHFVSVKHFGGENEFKNIQERDKKKFELCEEEDITLLYFSNLTSMNP